ncbi:MAG: hypothetical protein FJ271_21935 [Planctomycetes bacterium]|nr:hypothetical protein [Planctomycetota bacterium]
MLRRLTLLALAGSCTAFAVGFVLRDEEPVAAATDVRRLDYPLIARRTRELDERLRAYRAFVAARSAIVRDLAGGRPTMMRACERLRETASSEYRWFFQDLRRRYPLSLKEQLAFVLLGQIEMELDSHVAEALTRKLENEMVQPAFQRWSREPLQGGN